MNRCIVIIYSFDILFFSSLAPLLNVRRSVVCMYCWRGISKRKQQTPVPWSHVESRDRTLSEALDSWILESENFPPSFRFSRKRSNAVSMWEIVWSHDLDDVRIFLFFVLRVVFSFGSLLARTYIWLSALSNAEFWVLGNRNAHQILRS